MIATVQQIADEHPILVSITYYFLVLICGQMTISAIQSYVELHWHPYLLYATFTWIVYTASFENRSIKQKCVQSNEMAHNSCWRALI